ncbi:MmgE/PrpD family protein [Ancylobacter dichloromethanicus]|uniref:2-methylcitrate dehydratase n=1 Tax=Ancylobacter dichloromethanicus TaxID=518825 RepID=A0A9W6JDV8_9HYPH|nr:MmgE/PrpD family protein [Ancylobacter dichloromethanicus]MBS7553114.1 MmgE/PrpD family protein [Ancylobacter dichloromethanicus]GLK74631.1 2-methylcitrate dehydratase [Ancylobacter dichloromethanicus]
MNVQTFIHDLRHADLPPPVAALARRCLLDLVGVAASGRRTDLARIVTDHAARQFGAGEGRGARMIFDGRRVSPAGAAYVGASLIDSFDAHDGHALTKGHAGVAILPALLAFWEAEDLALDDREVLTSIVIGYEIATRAGIALHASACDYHTSGAWNALACAALGARLLKLSPAQTREALGTAEYHGPRSQMMRCIDHPTMLKDGSGWGALAGVSAAYLAADGFTGAPALTMEAPGQQALWGDLGTRWYILEQYFKPYPVCRWAQPAVEAARRLMAAHGLTGADIAEVEVRSFAEAVRLASARPATTEEAQYSLPFPLAAMIVRGRLGADEITGAGLHDAAVLDLSASIRLTEDPDICARFPAERFAVVSLGTRDGRHVTSEWTQADGGPANPLPDDEISAKFQALAGQLGDNRRQAIETLITEMGTGEMGTGKPAADLAELVLAPIGEAA